jgi:hypothetical protein
LDTDDDSCGVNGFSAGFGVAVAKMDCRRLNDSLVRPFNFGKYGILLQILRFRRSHVFNWSIDAFEEF